MPKIKKISIKTVNKLIKFASYTKLQFCKISNVIIIKTKSKDNTYNATPNHDIYAILHDKLLTTYLESRS